LGKAKRHAVTIRPDTNRGNRQKDTREAPVRGIVEGLNALLCQELG